MTISNPFAAPAAPSGFKPADNEGRLCLFEPTGSKQVDDQYNPGQRTDVIETTVTVLDGPGAPAVYADTLVFQKVMQSQLRPRVGQMVLGRVVKGQAKPGQSAPWMIQDPTEEEVAAGVAYLNRRQASHLQAPAQAPAPATTPGVPF